MSNTEGSNLLDHDTSRRKSSSGDSSGFEIGMHEIETPSVRRERTSSSGSNYGSGPIAPSLRYKGTNYMSTSAFQTMAEEIVRQRNRVETMAKSRSHDGDDNL